MRLDRVLPGLILAMAIGIWTGPAGAVIGIKKPISAIYQASAHVVVGKITATSGNLVKAEVTEALKGKAPAAAIVIQIVGPEPLASQVAVGQPVVVMITRAGAAAVNISDTWLSTEPIENKVGAWRAVQENQDLKQAFPGRTVALIRHLSELKAGKNGMLNLVDERVFVGGVRELGKLDAGKPESLVAADLTGTKKIDVLASAADRAHLFIATESGYKEQTDTWGLKNARGTHAVFGDVNGDGKADLVVGKDLWISQGGKFAVAGMISLPPDEQVLALTIADATGDGRPDIVVLRTNGDLVVFENPGSAEKQWQARATRRVWAESAGEPTAAAFGDFGDGAGLSVIVMRESGITRYGVTDDKEPAADFLRLVGQPLETFLRGNASLKGMSMGALDANGDGKMDLLLAGQSSGLLLMNRGYGAFFASLAAAHPLVGEPRPPFSMNACKWTGAARADGGSDLVVLTDDGRLFQVGNPPPAAGLK